MGNPVLSLCGFHNRLQHAFHLPVGFLDGLNTVTRDLRVTLLCAGVGSGLPFFLTVASQRSLEVRAFGFMKPEIVKVSKHHSAAVQPY